MSAASIKLNDGSSIPPIGYGIGTAHFSRECTQHIVSALKVGYRYLDAAQQYRNSKSIGAALKEWDGKREDLYILTKYGVPDVENDPRSALQTLLKEMGVDYVDMYLVHSPFFGREHGRSLADTWKIMEDLRKEGLTKSIGVSNFREEDIEEMSKSWEIPPAVNQIEYQPYLAHAPNVKRLLSICGKYDIRIMVYGGLVALTRQSGGSVDQAAKRIAKEKGVTDSQILLKWAQQATKGIIVTTSTNPSRQADQLHSVSIPDLTSEEMQAIRTAGEEKFFRHFMNPVWDGAKP